MRALIMAGGTDAKWTGPVRRHLMKVGSETVLERIVRQLDVRGVGDVIVIAPPLVGYELPDCRRVDPTEAGWGREALNGRSEWSPTGRTLQLYGDVIFTERAMDTIVGFPERRFQAFGRHGGGNGKRWGELFGMSFWPEHRTAWYEALTTAQRLKERGVIRRAGSWEGYRVVAGARGRAVGVHRRYPRFFTEIRDSTDDFDTMAEYERLTYTAKMPTAE